MSRRKLKFQCRCRALLDIFLPEYSLPENMAGRAVAGSQRAVAGGRWSMDAGRWPAVNKRWPAAGGQWTVAGGRRAGNQWAVDGGRMGGHAHGWLIRTWAAFESLLLLIKGGHFFTSKHKEPRRKRSKGYASYCNLFED